ncbi:hypothetical protein CEUSTIGMA_g2790.t1 [Chlamydomonas eustigma]|uniref:G-patch domain-containing protein n=1 Tax=Chlamydomonas eustigma TaxID=1157962 RepID=A0A250WX37_9CHLO|nr:hypothetical protein CEUSTIGMA_g2790.t1 [Chlamydomonas eustigma]|eukprot:GAX75346.1 hypothetical protein CEUSTIGMA_g2790.t1 [Chlamydomonas eustigma]
MDEEQQYEKFDVDNDFEGGEWIGGEFFYTGRRQKRQQREEDRLYGVFAEGSDSDEDRRSKRGGERKDYTRPVGFISSGIVNNKPEDNKSEEGTSYDVQGPPEQEGTAGLGSRGGGLGFKSAGLQHGGAQEEEDEEEEDGVLSTALGARIKQKVAERRKEEREERVLEKKRLETRAADPQFANFEKHSKGIGLKLLMKMGFKPGEGLGRDKGGIIKPIEVKLRPKGQALGFGVRHQDDDWDEERSRAAGKLSSLISDTKQPSGQKQDQQSGGRLWKKKHAEARVKREYRTADEVIKASGDVPAAAVLSAQPILDMRGPQVRLVTNLEHLNVKDTSDTVAVDKTPMPELQHNLQLLVDMCEADIQRLDAKLRHEQDTATLIGREKERLEREEQQQLLDLRRLKRVTEMVESCQVGGMDGFNGRGPSGRSLEELEEVYQELSTSYREEYVMYNLAAAAVVQVLPLLKVKLRGWQPLTEASHAKSEFQRLRPLLESAAARGPLASAAYSMASSHTNDPYMALVAELVLPPLRSACTGWEPREPEPLLTFLDEWESLLPPAAMGHVLEMLVMPKLRKATSDWEPRMETVPVHAWLHPWLPHLGSQLEELYPGIRHKLSIALQAWHPSDGSALALLAPWHRVFAPADWEAMLQKSIVPKLAYALQQLVVDPTSQDMSPFLWLTSWADVMPMNQMVSLLEHSFFPKWHQVLHYWLAHTPNYDEVTRWYLGWKGYFPAKILDHERIRQHFNLAVDAMNTSLEGGNTFGTPSAPFASRWNASDPTAASAGPAPPLPTYAAPVVSTADLTLRDLVQRFAEENGVQFMPKFGRFHDGLQVYSFGGVSVVLENNTSVVRAQLRDRWAPVSLETLLQQARLLGK